MIKLMSTSLFKKKEIISILNMIFWSWPAHQRQTENFSKGFSKRATGRVRTCVFAVNKSRVAPLRQHQQLSKHFSIFSIYAVTLLCTAAGPDLIPIGGGQLPTNPDECNHATRGIYPYPYI